MLAALSTCDPGDINTAIKAAKQQRVRVSGAPLLVFALLVWNGRAAAQVLGGVCGTAETQRQGGVQHGMQAVPREGYASHINRDTKSACVPALYSPAVVGLSAEMYVCRRMSQQTGGTYTGGEGLLAMAVV